MLRLTTIQYQKIIALLNRFKIEWSIPMETDTVAIDHWLTKLNVDGQYLSDADFIALFQIYQRCEFILTVKD